MSYVSPEMIDKQVYDFKVDLWGLGVVLIELLTNKSPFDHKDKSITRENICNYR